MNILLINHYAGSPQYGMEFRPYYMAREWLKLGHQVRIVAGDYSHVRSKQPQRPANKGVTWSEDIDGIAYQWIATPTYKGNGVFRVLNIMSFLWRVAVVSRSLLSEFRPDVVIASSTYPMDIWVARRIARLSKARLVFEVHDLWPLSPIEIGGMSRFHPFVQICQMAETAAYRYADLVVSMLPKMLEYVTSKGLPANRLTIIPNGMSVDDWQVGAGEFLRNDIEMAIDAAHTSGKLVVVYSGSHGRPNALNALLDAAKILSNANLIFLLVGDGHERERLVARVMDEKIDNVKMFMPIPKAQIFSLLAKADMAYLGAPRHSIYRFGISPNKMIDYMMAGIPIVYAIEAGNDPIADAQCGISLPAENPQELANGIRMMATFSVKHRRLLGENGRKYAVEHHSYSALATSFINAITTAKVRQ